MKVVINTCYGGFGLSLKAKRDLRIDSDYDIERDNLALVSLIETKGSKYVSDENAQLKIVEINEAHYVINDYDGMERVIASDSPIKFY